ncbi:restriction endonuclease subunit S [Alistipes shahii]|uniref:restriction endonuclease subunit S n=1 Tax=Alistipes shahii TaxID=328814 RepID=UPI003CEAB6DB
MNSDWTTCKIGDICKKICSGGTPKSNEPSYYGGNIPWLNTKEINFNRIYNTEKYITSSGFDNSSAKWIDANSVIVALYGATAAKVSINTIPLTTNQACCNLTIDETVADYRYVYYYLRRNYQHLALLANGGAQQNLNAQQIKDFNIILPQLPIQHKIANILWTIDDKIELNRRINDNLEEQAKALFKSWFVDNQEPTWEKKTLADIVNIWDSMRKPLSATERDKMQKIYPYYGATSLMDYVDNYLFDGIYLLMGEDGTVVDDKGFPILQYVYGKFWVNNHAHVLTGANGFSTECIYILLSTTNVKSIVTGAVQPKINQANLKNIPIVIPPEDVLSDYKAIIHPLFAKIRNNSMEIHRLTIIHDTLLPKLMSGELSVEEVSFD